MMMMMMTIILIIKYFNREQRELNAVKLLIVKLKVELTISYKY